MNLATLASLVLLMTQVEPESHQAAVLVGGDYGVGFSSAMITDASRRDIDDRSAPRRIRASWWYPSEQMHRTVRYGDYVELLAADAGAPPDAWQMYADWLVNLGGTQKDPAAWRRALSDLPTMASRDASPAPGTFPVIVFPGRVAGVSVLAETLASHGFVVASFAIRGATTQALKWWSPSAMEAIALDADRVAEHVQQQTYADRGPWTFIGLGISASAGLVAAMDNQRIETLVSLEGGITTAGESRIVEQSTNFSIQAVRLPMLVIHAPHPHVDVSRVNRYRYSDRTYAYFPAMSEFHFLSFGWLEQFTPGIIGEAKGETWQDLQDAADLIVAYLRSRQQGQALDIQKLSFDSVELSQHAAVPPPLSDDDLVDMLASAGVEGIARFRSSAISGDPKPISLAAYQRLERQQTLSDVPEQRLTLLQLARQDHPGSAVILYTIARLHQQQERLGQAEEYYRLALNALSVDGDRTLIGERRQQYADAIADRLAELDR